MYKEQLIPFFQKRKQLQGSRNVSISPSGAIREKEDFGNYGKSYPDGQPAPPQRMVPGGPLLTAGPHDPAPAEEAEQ